MTNIEFPSETTYFVSYNDLDNIGYGVNTIEQQTISTSNNFEIFTDIDSWKLRLLQLGVTCQ